MNEHEQIMAIIRAKNESPIPLDPHRTGLIVVDRRGASEQVPDGAHDEAPSGECRSNHQGRNIMNRLSTLTLTTMALLFLGVALPSGDAVGQQKTLKEQLVGTWTFVSAVNTRPDGTKFDPWGGKAAGVLVFDSTGHFSWQVIRSDIPKLASNNRLEGTADEFKAVAQGALSYFGTYSLDDSGKTLTQHIKSSSFPNFNGANRIWAIALTGDELTIASQAGAAGGTNELKWKRVK